MTQKIALQINCKLGGELWALEIPLVREGGREGEEEEEEEGGRRRERRRKRERRRRERGGGGGGKEGERDVRPIYDSDKKNVFIFHSGEMAKYLL